MIIPAIDIIQGQTVRLFKGDYKQITFYEAHPLDLIQIYSEAGAELIHVVDLQGAKEPSQRQFKLISELARSTEVIIQTGGGIRSEQDVAELLEAGAQRVVIGSLAINEPDMVATWFSRFGPEQIVLALDVSLDNEGNKWLPTLAWQQSGGRRLEEILKTYLPLGIKHILCTDISRDGTLQGSNNKLYSELVEKYPAIQWQASGGIGSLADIGTVAGTGVSGIIVGKALLDGKFNLKEALECWRDA